MAKLDALRQIIREEVRTVFQQELAGILKEAILTNKTSVIAESKPKPDRIPGTLNARVPKMVAPNLGASNPLNALLAETAMAMTTDDYESMGLVEGVQKETPIVQSVNDMLATARPSSNLDAIQINAVPDFTGIMARMKEKGEI